MDPISTADVKRRRRKRDFLPVPWEDYYSKLRKDCEFKIRYLEKLLPTIIEPWFYDIVITIKKHLENIIKLIDSIRDTEYLMNDLMTKDRLGFGIEIEVFNLEHQKKFEMYRNKLINQVNDLEKEMSSYYTYLNDPLSLGLDFNITASSLAVHYLENLLPTISEQWFYNFVSSLYAKTNKEIKKKSQTLDKGKVRLYELDKERTEKPTVDNKRIEKEKKFQGFRKDQLRWYELHSERTEKFPVGNKRIDKEKKQNDLKILKIVIVGENTFIENFCKNFSTNFFVDNYRNVIGLDFWSKNVEISEQNYKLQIWQLLSEKRFQHLYPIYLRGANGAIIMYDINKAGSLKFIFAYIDIIKKNVKNIPIFLAVDESLSKLEKIEDFTDKYSFTDISSEIGQKGEYVFELLTKKVLEYRA